MCVCDHIDKKQEILGINTDGRSLSVQAMGLPQDLKSTRVGDK